jgi:SNF2 family DNA or RNA helicase
VIIAPKSVIGNWVKEAAKFTPGLRVLLLEGGRRSRYHSVLGSCDLLLTTYPVLARDIEVLAKQPFHCAVLDEAQTIKNPRSQTARAACRLNARTRVCLSGTPIENHLGELWSLFHFLMPGFLGSSDNFSRSYRRPIEKENDSGRLLELQERVAPYLLRRTKDLVATELPPKTEIVRTVELGPGQADLYEVVRASVNEQIADEIAERGIDASRMVILTAIMKLRQLCCDPRLLKLRGDAGNCGSAKLEMLMEMLAELTAGKRRIIIFSQFTSMLELIAERLEKAGMRFLTLTGASKDRMKLVEEFQSGKVPVFLISLKAGATGLNLTAADTVIHYDPWWNPAVESQATDRAYRIGQTQPVFVYKLVGEGTIEEKILKLQQRKAMMTKTILGQNCASLDLSASQIDELLAPLG